MYTAFYGLREKPFALSPDPRFLYLAGSHREALAHLLYGIEQGEGFIAVTGEVGTGKTTLCRTLLERLEGHTELAFLFNPSRSALELMQSICAELGLPAEGLGRRALMAQLNGHLLEQRRRGRRVLLIIDEAQTLSATTLEQVRLLSNLETSREKLIQILLLGQPELDRKLDERSLRQLRQRISVRWKLAPLGPHETRAYVRHRLAIAAGEPRDLFSDTALREIHRRAGGIPRLVNQLCDRALLAGYAARAARIGPGLVRAAAREIPDASRFRARGSATRNRRPWLFFAAPLAVLLAALAGGLQVGRAGLAAWLNERSALPPVAAAALAEKTLDGAGSPSPAILARLIESVPPARWVDEAQPEARSSFDPGAIHPASPSSEVAPRPVEETTALDSELLRRLLDARSAPSTLAESQRALLQRFGRRGPDRPGAPPASADALRASVEARGLMATPFEGGSLALLRQLDHPVLLALAPPTRSGRPAETARDEARWLVLTGFEGQRARLAGLLPDRTVTVRIEELEAHWLERGIVVWERFEPVPRLLSQGDEGSGVRWLQRSLVELEVYTGRPSGLFDAATRRAVRRFQRSQGLVADGIAGPLTQIALYGNLERYPVPRLSQAVGRSLEPLPRVAPGPSASSSDPGRSRSQETDRG